MGRLSSPRVRRALVAVGLGGIGVAALLRVAPGLLPAPVRRPLAATLSAVPGEPVLWGLALLAGVYALVRAATGGREPTAPPEFGREGTDGGASTDGVPTVGAGFERAVDRAATDADDPRAAGRAVRERLRATATAALARRTDASADAARAAVAAGEWTDDRVAAAFLGGDSAPNYTLAERVRGWIRPDRAFRDRADRTVRAIGAVAAEGDDAGSPPWGEDQGTVDPGTEPGSDAARSDPGGGSADADRASKTAGGSR